MKNLLKLVEQFQVGSEQTVNKNPIITEKFQEMYLRFELMKEENSEYIVAVQNKDLTEVLDACIDMAYILFGTINMHGLQDIFEEGFKIVHENNMTKIGPDGKVIRDASGKILKPVGYKKVDLTNLIK